MRTHILISRWVPLFEGPAIGPAVTPFSDEPINIRSLVVDIPIASSLSRESRLEGDWSTDDAEDC